MIIKQVGNKQTRKEFLTKWSHTSAVPNKKCKNICQIVSKSYS